MTCTPRRLRGCTCGAGRGRLWTPASNWDPIRRLLKCLLTLDAVSTIPSAMPTAVLIKINRFPLSLTRRVGACHHHPLWELNHMRTPTMTHSCRADSEVKYSSRVTAARIAHGYTCDGCTGGECTLTLCTKRLKGWRLPVVLCACITLIARPVYL